MYIEFNRISTKQKYLDVNYHVTIEPGIKLQLWGLMVVGNLV